MAFCAAFGEVHEDDPEVSDLSGDEGRNKVHPALGLLLAGLHPTNTSSPNETAQERDQAEPDVGQSRNPWQGSGSAAPLVLRVVSLSRLLLFLSPVFGFLWSPVFDLVPSP